MITVLQRQNVSKRAAPPIHIRTRTNGVRWTKREPPSPPPRTSPPRSFLRFQAPRRLRLLPPRPPGEHSFLKGQLIAGKRRRAARRAERKALRKARRALLPSGIQRKTETRHSASAIEEKSPGKISRRAAGILRHPWLFVGLALAIVAVVVVLAAGAPVLSLPQPKPALPAPAEIDQALYGLLVPEPAPRPDAGVNPVLLTSLKLTKYRSQAGDALSKIAARFKLNVDTVVSWNGITDARALGIGTTLDIPNADGLKYTVRRGDTLQGIAQAWNVDFNSLVDWNRLPNSVISIGQQLFLPGARMNPTELNRILGSLFIYPVQGRISSYFGERPDPFSGVESSHNGIDIVNKPGTPIMAAMAGTVGDTGFNGKYGYYVILLHPGNYQTLYGHLRVQASVKRGQKVQQGQAIGELGTTGYSTGPHLHFSIFRNGVPVDPLRFLK